jgi:NADPH:quinone reductase-like Zn-dependent oxidoreductase
MKALLLKAPHAAFQMTDVARPVPGPGQVLVRVAASGVNPLDLRIRAGTAGHARHPLPAILGIDMAGTVEAIGPDVDGFSLGEAVYGMTGGVGGVPGSLAEYTAVDARLLASKPQRLSMREAAALPLIVITAWEGLVDRARLAAGQTVLIQAGAGGVGHAAVQIARALGAEVFATHRGGHGEYLHSIGAVPIDTREAEMATIIERYTAGRGFDVVFDTVGGTVLDESFVAVKRFGHVVSALGWGTHALAPLSFKSASFSGVFTLLPLLTGEGREHHGATLREAARLTDAGKLSPRLDPRHYDLATAGQAHKALAHGNTAGKIVVSIA